MAAYKYLLYPRRQLSNILLATKCQQGDILTTLLVTNSLVHCRHIHGNGSRKVSLRKEGEEIHSYMLSRYMDYVENYKKILESRFPSAMNMYRIFSIGIKDFYKDLKLYIPQRMKFPPTEKNLQEFSRQEIELYYRMPKDMWRIAPVLILSAVPFGNYVIFPLALLKPRKLLTSHFWSMQQRAEFAVLDLCERLSHNDDVCEALERKLDSAEDLCAQESLRRVLVGLQSGVHPNAKDVLKCKPLFIDGPFNLKKLDYWHVSHLLHTHGLHRGLFRRYRLHYHAHIIAQMDKAIIREGGPDALGTDSLRFACYIRGLNSSHLTNHDMIRWLRQWLDVSQDITKDSFSLLLHCPVLLAHNHPQNWKLLT